MTLGSLSSKWSDSLGVQGTQQGQDRDYLESWLRYGCRDNPKGPFERPSVMLVDLFEFDPFEFDLFGFELFGISKS